MAEHPEYTIERELDYYKRQIKELSALAFKQDASLSTTRHKLRQKERGFALLSKLQAVGTINLDPLELVETTLQEINQGLQMDICLLMRHHPGTNTYYREMYTGKIAEIDTPELFELEIPEQYWKQGYLIKHKSSPRDDVLKQLSGLAGVPFYVCLPWEMEGQRYMLIAGRKKEGGPFSPKMDHGDYEILQSVLSFMSARLEMQTMKNQAVEQERIQAELKLQAEQEKARSVENELRARAAEAQARALDAEERRKREELERARSVQMAMLPKEIPDIPGYEIAVAMITATEVGGDYYDFIISSEHEFTLIVGDASGHGTSAGLMMVMTKVALKSCPETEPANILGWMNNLLKSTNPANLNMAMNATRVCGNKVTFSSAAIPPLFYYDSAKHEVVEKMIGGLPLGAMKGISYQEQQFEMKNGDQILILTDGFPETENAKQEQIGYDILTDLVRENAHLTAAEQIEKLVAFEKNWRGNLDQEDDITLMILRKVGDDA